MSTPDDSSGAQLRAGDADRRRTADRLSQAVREGELTPDEHAERAAAAAAARTRGELAELTKDLAPDPVPEPWQRAAATPAPYERPRRRRDRIAQLASGWRSWAGTAVVLTAIWGMASMAAGHLTTYWPVWPLGMWAVALIITGIRGNDD